MIRKIEGVLLVEDDPITNFLNKRIVDKLQLADKVDIAQNGFEAIQYLEKLSDNNIHFPELIFLDINMPIMNGLEFLEKYNDLSFHKLENVVIVMLTSSTHIRDMETLLNFDHIDFLSKPLTEEKVTLIANKYFNVPQLGQTA